MGRVQCYIVLHVFFVHNKVSLFDRLGPYLGSTDKFSYGLLTIWRDVRLEHAFLALKWPL